MNSELVPNSSLKLLFFDKIFGMIYFLPKSPLMTN